MSKIISPIKSYIPDIIKTQCRLVNLPGIETLYKTGGCGGGGEGKNTLHLRFLFKISSKRKRV